MKDYDDLVARLELADTRGLDHVGRNVLREAAAAISELRQDAERYRWFREDCFGRASQTDGYSVLQITVPWRRVVELTDVDAAIDAAMKAGK